MITLGDNASIILVNLNASPIPNLWLGSVFPVKSVFVTIVCSVMRSVNFLSFVLQLNRENKLHKSSVMVTAGANQVRKFAV